MTTDRSSHSTTSSLPMWWDIACPWEKALKKHGILYVGMYHDCEVFANYLRKLKTFITILLHPYMGRNFDKKLQSDLCDSYGGHVLSGKSPVLYLCNALPWYSTCIQSCHREADRACTNYIYIHTTYKLDKKLNLQGVPSLFLIPYSSMVEYSWGCSRNSPHPPLL